MSRNFDILQKAEDNPAALRSVAMPLPHPNAGFSRRNRKAAADDEVIKLVQRVFLLPGGAKAVGVVAFCGIDEGDGCSWLCARASEVLAMQQTASVCVVDANLRSPSLHAHFQLENGLGFADAVKDSRPIREFARRTSVSNLWLITAGAVGKEPNGALNPPRLRSRITELRGEFDHILMDTPAINSYSDAVLVGQATDGIILVVGSSSTRREPARRAKESLESAKVPMLGAVLNKRTFPIPESIYRRL